MSWERVNKKVLALHFSKSAGNYEREALLQREVAFTLAQWLAEDRAAVAAGAPGPEVLEIGCGTGFLTRFLEERLAPSRLTALDLAPGMLARLRQGRPVAAGRLGLVLADGERLPFREESFDLVASSTTFQWFDSLEVALAGCWRALRPGGVLAFATLGRGTFRELREAYRTSAGQMGIKLTAARYGPPLTGEAELEELLARTGFGAIELAARLKHEFYSSAREFFLALKRRGSNNPNYRPMSLPVERTLLRKVAEYYDRRFRVDGRVYAGYEVIFARCRKS